MFGVIDVIIELLAKGFLLFCKKVLNFGSFVHFDIFFSIVNNTHK